MLRLSLSQEVGEEGEEGEEGADMNMHGEDRSRDEGRTRESRPEAAGGAATTLAHQSSRPSPLDLPLFANSIIVSSPYRLLLFIS